MRNVCKRGNSWYVRMRIDGRDQWRSCGQDKQRAIVLASEARSRKESEKIVGQNDDLGKLFSKRVTISFADAVAQYLMARQQLKAASLRNYQNYARHLNAVFGNQPLHVIEEAHIELFMKRLQDAEFSPKHVNDIVRFARSVCNVQLKRTLISRNPFANIKLLREKRLRPRDDEINPLSKDELATVLAILPDQWRPIFTVLAYTGMRPGEALALRWRDVDRKKAVIKIRRARVKGVEDTPKTESSIRDVHLTSKVLDVLKTLKESRNVQGIDDYVFVRADGKPFNKYVDDAWKRALKKAGIAHRPSYQLRHTYVSLCLQNGIEPGWIAKQIGHSSLKTTFEKYSRYIPTTNTLNQAKLEKLFAGTGSRTRNNRVLKVARR